MLDSHQDNYSRPAVLLATSLAQLTTPNGNQQVRMLIDPGSELSFISDQIVTLHQLTRQRSTIQIKGVGDVNAGHTKGVCTIKLTSNYSNEHININAHILSTLTSTLPSFNSHTQQWPHLTALKLADPHYMTPRSIDIIIGADAYGSVIQDAVIKYTNSTPIAQSTIFGWIVLGPTTHNALASIKSHHITADVSNQDLQLMLKTFWEQEEVPTSTKVQFTPDEQACEDHFITTHTRDKSGRYIVRIPLNSSPKLLGDSLVTAQHCLRRLTARMAKNNDYNQLYIKFLQEYEQLNHMRRTTYNSHNTAQPSSASDEFAKGMTLAQDVSASGGLRVPLGSLSSQQHYGAMYYLPHHGVMKEDSLTTKLRVVFNGSSSTSSSYSLNDIQHTGAKHQLDLPDVLLWIRKHRFMFATDVTKMYRQINVHEDDWDLQRILWVDNDGNTIPYQLTTVTYGTKSAPFLAIRTMLQLTKDEGHRFPLAIDSLLKGRYVDDIYGGSDNINELIQVAIQVKGLCMAGGFPLAKWQSNHQSFRTQFSPDSQMGEVHTIDDSKEEPSSKVLGLKWHPHADVFKFNSRSDSTSSKLTKRIILSKIAQLFDLLGFLSPLTIRSKILMQELWLEKLTWDEPVSHRTHTKWNQLNDELRMVSTISVPRWYHTTDSSTIELHGFSDASQLAMAAVIYIKVTDDDGTIHTTLVCAKSKVAPLKRLTIPRLELSAALILAKLARYVQTTLELTHNQTYLWTDSSVTLTWIKSHPSRWKDFVRNRVCQIQDLVPNSEWKFIPGKDNPADCASRGLSISQLQKHHLWWTGPPWLKQECNSWPTPIISDDSPAQQEERPGHTLILATTHTDYHWEMIYRYSSLIRLLRVTSICFRVRDVLNRRLNSTLVNPISPSDIETARQYWIKSTQAAYFKNELKVLTSLMPLPSTHPFNRLTAFIDTQGVIRVGGRLAHAHLNPDMTHPAILPRHSQLTQLIVANAHEKTLHGGTQLTLNYIRKRYWIIGGRYPVKTHILRCIKCARHRGIRAQQLMGQLPSARVTPSRPFNIAGVDYAGPLSIKTWRGRGAKVIKGWLCLFVCFTTSAVHLEVVTEYTTESFIAAFRRFTGRRGSCSTLHSDCGKNFEGANPILQQSFKAATHENNSLICTLANDGTTWRFNPPAAPHMGGKWEAAVKSVKHHLTRTIGDTSLTYEELNTLLIQIEAVLNSRPLEPLSDDPEDVSALTPAHFLIGDASTTLPGPAINDINYSTKTRWQFIQQRLQYFWSQWSTQYLQRQLAISKWHHPNHSIKVGTLVLLTDERCPPSKWPLARIINLHPGPDGLTRVVTLKTATTTLKRPIAKLSILPVPVHTNEDNS